jgi:cell wall-associated NlpC family hydrolase
VAGGVGAGAIPLIAATGSAAAPLPVGALRAQAAQIADQVATMQAKIGILSEEYDQAASRAASLNHQKLADASALSTAQSNVLHDIGRLRAQAVSAYVDAGGVSGGSLTTALSGSATSLPIQQTYIAAASSSLNSSIATLHNAEITLNARKATLATAESHARANADALATSRSSAAALESQLQGKLSGVTRSLQAAVAQAAAAAQAQAAAAAAAQAASAQAAAAAAGGPVGGVVTSIGNAATPSPPSSSGGSGSAAVAAAESQTGVPYQWAGATPGSGFDCSGLTMWAWSHAGVSLPHSAAGQYGSIEHVSASQLQPGDLIFYASGGYIYHVVMYIGGGQIIQAEHSGTLVHSGPIPGGAMGYGRP